MQGLLKYKSFVLYGLAMAIVILVLKWLELRFLILKHSEEIYMGAIALLFTMLGVWLAIKLTKPKIQVETVWLKKRL